jgi:tRNA-dihydrouridine synthase
MRLCWHTQDYMEGRACSPDLARALADAGVVAVTVHGRTTEMKFSGSVLHEGIARVVDSVNGRIPVIGNGDVREPADAIAMMRATGCSGVMIGRGALSSPWIFRDAWALQTIGAVPPPPTVEQKIALVRRFFDLMRTYHDDRYALFQINRRISWFAKRLTETRPDGSHVGVKPFKEAVRLAKTCQEVYDALDQFRAGGLRGGAAEPQEAAA